MAAFFKQKEDKAHNFLTLQPLKHEKRNSDIEVVSNDAPPLGAEQRKVTARARVKFITQLDSEDSDESL
jgi:hypothetical protein